MEKVFCVVDHYIKTLGDNKETTRNWEKIQRYLPRKITRPKHSIVHDREGNKICRPDKLNIGLVANYGPNYGAFNFYCNTVKICMSMLFEELNISPNVIVSFGGARIFAWHLLFHFFSANKPEHFRYGIAEMQRTERRKKVVGFNYDLRQTVHQFKPHKVKAILLNDSIYSARSAELAIHEIRKQGGEVLGVVSFANSFGDEWPFNVPMNLSFINLRKDFTKYPAGACPTCKSLQK